MQLSDAIRLGAMLKPQEFGHLLANGRTCAFGAAFDALGLLEVVLGTSLASATLDQWPWLLTHAPHPIIAGYVEPAINVILKLNDVEHWSRERIADWVASVEPSNASQPVAAVLVEIGTQ